MSAVPKANFIGAPECFALELACRDICDAFSGYGCYLVGSALQVRDWRDVDVRFIMEDAAFDALFPRATNNCWEQDTRWLLLTVSISEHLSKVTGLPVDFQFQRQSHANERHLGPRHAIGLRIAKPDVVVRRPKMADRGRGKKINPAKNAGSARDLKTGKKFGRPKQVWIWDRLPESPKSIQTALADGSGHWERVVIDENAPKIDTVGRLNRRFISSY